MGGRVFRDGSNKRWVAALLAGATFIGVAPILVRMSEVGPSATALYRVVLAMPIYAAWLRWNADGSTGNGRGMSRRTLIVLALAGVCFAGDLSLWHWSLQFTSVANSTLLSNLAPVFVLVGARLFLRERAGAGLIAGVFVAMAGAALLVLESMSLSRESLRGDLLAIVTAVFYAGYIVTMKRARREVSTPEAMLYSGMVSAPLFFLAGWFAGEDLWPNGAEGWAVLAGLAVISHVLGQGFIASGLAHLPASFSAASLLWQPVVAAGLAAIFLGEQLTMAGIIGGLVVLLGVYLAQRSLPR